MPASLFARSPALSGPHASADERSPLRVIKDQLPENGKDRVLAVGAIKPVIAIGTARN